MIVWQWAVPWNPGPFQLQGMLGLGFVWWPSFGIGPVLYGQQWRRSGRFEDLELEVTKSKVVATRCGLVQDLLKTVEPAAPEDILGFGQEIHVELEHAVLYPSTSIWLTFVPQVQAQSEQKN